MILKYPKLVAAVLVALALGGSLAIASYYRRKAMDAQRDLEKSQAEAAGLLESDQARQSQLNSLEKQIVDSNATIASQKSALDKLAHTKPERVYVLKTTPAKAPGANGECLLTAGDPYSFRVRVLDYRSAKGNLTIMGDAALDRGVPPSEVVSGTFTAQAGSVVTEAGVPAAGAHRASWAIRAGPTFSGLTVRPAGAFLGMDRRLFGRLWVTAEAMSNGPAAVGLRWEW